ncbi:MAG: DNA polymerase III subunit beta [Alphaproteobacteria bacterium]|nr:DNA polymerase III subunit beta [Alphaproteobacteria bacterium]
MRLTVERGAFLKSLNHVQSVVERRNTIPILSNVLIDAQKDRLSLMATDLDIEIVESLEAEISRPGATTVSAHRLYDVVRKLPEGSQAQLDANGAEGHLRLNAGRSKFQLTCLPREDFPAMTAGNLPHHFGIDAADLRRLIDKTRFAISTEETRYYLNGVYLHAFKGKDQALLRAVATDGHRLARFEIPLPEGAAEMPGVIVPRKAVQELRKLLDDATGPIEVAVSDTKIRFAFGSVILTSKLIDGTFPDYQRVIPSGNDKILDVNASDLAEAVDRVATISAEKTRAVKLNLERDRLTLSVVNPEAGSANEELPVDYGAEPLEIGFNARYLLDILQQLDGSEAKFLLADAGSPTVVRDAGEGADLSTLYVLMPMRV